MIVSLIAAVAENGVIGTENRLPWKIPADLRRFKALTSGHSVIMGRKTLESIGRPLPSRRNIVITRNRALRTFPGVEIAGSIEEALGLCDQETEAFILGGAQIYAVALRYASRIYLTQVHRPVAGDAFFPEWNREDFKLVSRDDYPESVDNPLPFSYLVYERLRERA